MNKKKLPLIIGILVLAILVIGGGIFAFTRKSAGDGKTTQEQTKKKVAVPVNIIPVDQRPYVQIVPLADGHNLNLVVKALKKPATEVDYELEYQAGSQLQGAFGLIELANVPAEFKVLLGSCSAGGACTFHENVQGGTFLGKFAGAENYAVKSDWRYIDNKNKETAIASTDSKFQLTADSLKTQRYLVVYNTPGYPEGLKGTPVSDPYSLTASAPLSGKGTLTMRASEDGQFTIMGWDGKAWKSFTAKMDGKAATAEVDLMELYVLVKN